MSVPGLAARVRERAIADARAVMVLMQSVGAAEDGGRDGGRWAGREGVGEAVLMRVLRAACRRRGGKL